MLQFHSLLGSVGGLSRDKLLLSRPSLQSFLWNLLKSSRHVTSRNLLDDKVVRRGRGCISCLWNQNDITSFVIIRNLFSFRLNGVKANYFCGELSHVSVLLAILCLSVLPQALLYSCFFCVPIFPRNIGNQDDITSFLIMRNLFSFRLNGRKSNYFCGESSNVSVLVVLLAILCLSVLSQALFFSLLPI